MPVRRYAVCDECMDAEIEYSTLKNRDATDFKYGDIMDSGKPAFAKVSGWLVKARPSDEDALVIEHEFYCPECTAADEIEDSGDRSVYT